MTSTYKDYSAARKEWTQILIDKVAPAIYNQYKILYADSVELANSVGASEKKKYDPARVFDLTLSDIPVWNSAVIKDQTNKIVEKVPRLKDFLRPIALSHCYVMSSVRVGINSSKPLDTKVPSVDSFVHCVFINSYEDMEANFFEFPISRKKRQEAYSIISASIPKALRSLIDPDQVLDTYLDTISEQNEYGVVEHAPTLPENIAPEYEKNEKNEKIDKIDQDVKSEGLHLREELDEKDKEAFESKPRRSRSSHSSHSSHSLHSSSKIIHIPEEMMKYKNQSGEKDFERMLEDDAREEDEVI